MKKIMINSSGLVFLQLLIFTLTGHAQVRPAHVNLAANQTEIRNQGSRTTCITFAAIAALEAAYKKAGYGDLDLSEQFLNHVGKTFWLHQRWNEILAKGNDGSETQVGAFGGGNSGAYIIELSRIMKVPVETIMPYRNTEYTAADFAPLANVWNSPYWKKQKRMSDFNLDKRFLPQAALTADKYYSVRSYRKLGVGNDPIEIEKALAAGKEVAWDVDGAFPRTALWDTCMACPKRGAHAMLIIGYDRRDADPKKHYFLIKNSWGRTSATDGYTRVTYDYVRAYGRTAVYIESVNPPMRWHELAFIGRWDLNFDGHKGILDIYHIPHHSESEFNIVGVTTKDNRIGTFYDQAGKAFKVNGSITGASIRFYIDGDSPDARWDAVRGREFSYTLLQDKGLIMAGMHKDPDGKIYGGYARKDQTMQQTSPIPGVINTASYVGKWNVRFNNINGTLSINKPDAVIAASFMNGRDHDGFTGTLQAGTVQHPVKFFVNKKNPNHITMQIPGILGTPGMDGGAIRAYLLNFDKGHVAGTALYSDSQQYGFLMMRTQAVTVIVR